MLACDSIFHHLSSVSNLLEYLFRSSNLFLENEDIEFFLLNFLNVSVQFVNKFLK